VLLDTRAGLGALEVGGEPRHVQPERARVIDDARLGHRLVAVVDPIVHFPEPALVARRLSFGRDARRSGVSVLVREVAEDVDEAFTQGFPQPQHYVAEALAIGTQKIAVRDDLDGVAPATSAHVVSRPIDRPPEADLRRARCRRLAA